MSNIPWWKGAHGEWYVVAQAALFGLVLVGPRSMPGWPAWILPYALLGSIVGLIAMLAGGLGFVAGIAKLGTNLTAVPYPKDQGKLIETGPYCFVRHPMYSGMILFAFGWAFWSHSWLAIGYAVILFLFFDIKARREEKWLTEKFPGYPAYQARVRKLIPFVY